MVGIGAIKVAGAGFHAGNLRTEKAVGAGHFDFARGRFGIGVIKEHQPEALCCAVDDKGGFVFMDVYTEFHRQAVYATRIEFQLFQTLEKSR